MLEKFFYFAMMLAEAGLAVFGATGTFEQPPYAVRGQLEEGLEIRDYRPQVAVETTLESGSDEHAAFRRLFDYITGDNGPDQLIAMTMPVRLGPAGSAGPTMRFFLPAKFAARPPPPKGRLVRIVRLPAMTVAAYRFTGNPTPQARQTAEATLMRRLSATSWRPVG